MWKFERLETERVETLKKFSIHLTLFSIHSAVPVFRLSITRPWRPLRVAVENEHMIASRIERDLESKRYERTDEKRDLEIMKNRERYWKVRE